MELRTAAGRIPGCTPEPLRLLGCYANGRPYAEAVTARLCRAVHIAMTSRADRRGEGAADALAHLLDMRAPATLGFLTRTADGQVRR